MLLRRCASIHWNLVVRPETKYRHETSMRFQGLLFETPPTNSCYLLGTHISTPHIHTLHVPAPARTARTRPAFASNRAPLRPFCRRSVDTLTTSRGPRCGVSTSLPGCSARSSTRFWRRTGCSTSARSGSVGGWVRSRIAPTPPEVSRPFFIVAIFSVGIPLCIDFLFILAAWAAGA